MELEDDFEFFEKALKEINSLTDGYSRNEAAWLVEWLEAMFKDPEFRAKQFVKIRLETLRPHVEQARPYYYDVNFGDYPVIFDKSQKAFPTTIDKRLQSFLSKTFHTPEKLYKWLCIVDENENLTSRGADLLHRLAINQSEE